MPATAQPIQTFEFVREEMIEASVDLVFQSVLDELGPQSQMPDGKPMPLKLEAWPGGRWFRDLGNNSGHFWGHVQVIKPPSLIEIYGPMFMSYPAANHVQYRLAAEGKGTKLTLSHRSFGLIPKEQMDSMNMGWGYKLKRVREIVMRQVKH